MQPTKIIVPINIGEPVGLGEYQYQKDGALIRPFKKLLDHSHPMEKLTCLLLEHPTGSLPSSIIGTVLFSNGRRLIFYPGIKDRKFKSSTNPSRLLNEVIDHITVEADMKSFHYTTLDGKHEAPRNTTELEPDLVHLFGFSIAGSHVLEPTPSSFSIALNASETDVERRHERLNNIRNDLRYVLITPYDDIAEPKILHFDFFADLRPVRDDVNPSLSTVPSNAPELKTDIDSSKTTNYKVIDDVLVPDFPGVLVVQTIVASGTLLHAALVSHSPRTNKGANLVLAR